MHIYCGLKRQPPYYRFEASEYDLCHLIYLATGTLFMTVQNVVTTLTSGMACYLPLGTAFRLHCAETGYQGVCAVLSGALPDLYRGEAQAVLCPPEMRMVAGMIDAEARNPGDRTEAILSRLGLLLVDLAIRQVRVQQRGETAVATAAAWVRDACQRIEKAIYTHQSLEECLCAVPLSYRQLSRHFQQVMGVTPKQYQLRCRLAEAERLLLATRLPITSIALELGFASSQHFSTQFAQQRGLAPSAFRTQRRDDLVGG